ncbi:hypothetical protein [Mesorhizobium sp. B2-3-2]|uniref:hypothetical protein n=1 Tax=Mesorhizobium sp. B2-3-2 TaxID=2589961 RepID=UPI00112EAB4A|nr:hypothetical protein [Mesorhizobium sp. B2-3-2]TPM37017.1 hypothetical protein FJ964_30235 [Mesorhizobium sp. B2-3-2]
MTQDAKTPDEKLIRAGKLMANILFNLDQRGGLGIDEHRCIKSTREEWDDAIAAWNRRALRDGEATEGVEASLDERMEAAGMIPLSKLLAGDTPLARWEVHTSVRDLASFEQWLQMRHREIKSLRVKYELGDKDETDDLYEWVLAHDGAFSEVAANFRQAKDGWPMTPYEKPASPTQAVTVNEVEKIILDTEPPDLSDRGDKIWTRRMACLLADLFNARLSALDRTTLPPVTPGAEEAFAALDLADRLIERGYGNETPKEWHNAYRAVAKARSAPQGSLP